MDSFRPSSQSLFRSRRSHPQLNHISLAPLTPRFPIDDLPEYGDYFTDGHGSTSYLSSSSVPSTPPILSHSHSGSRVRHHKRSKSSSLVLSDTNLQNLGTGRPLHHHIGRKKNVQSPGALLSPKTTTHRDSEWLLRTGLALASSAREEKGQSWLVKRESSTSLVSDGDYEDARSLQHTRSSRTPRSGLSSPTCLSRRASRSRGGSRRASRADLSMTALDTVASQQWHHSRQSSRASERGTLVADFVDEQIRAEMESIHRDIDEDEESLSSFGSDSNSDDDIDEMELQRLTRERGFGLGSWIDQFVGWTLFGVEDDYASFPTQDRLVSFDNGSQPPQALGVDDYDDEDDSSEEPSGPIEKAGQEGGWADASWFLRLARNAIM